MHRDSFTIETTYFWSQTAVNSSNEDSFYFLFFSAIDTIKML